MGTVFLKCSWVVVGLSLLLPSLTAAQAGEWVDDVVNEINRQRDRQECLNDRARIQELHILGVNSKDFQLPAGEGRRLLDQLLERLQSIRGLRTTDGGTFEFIAGAISLGNDRARDRLSRLDRGSVLKDIVVVLVPSSGGSNGVEIVTRFWTNKNGEMACSGVVRRPLRRLLPGNGEPEGVVTSGAGKVIRSE